MRSLPLWANLLGEVFCVALLCLAVYVFARIESQTVPLWAWIVVSSVGIQMWRKVDYNRPQDMEPR